MSLVQRLTSFPFGFVSATRGINKEIDNGSVLLSPIRDRTSAFSVFSPTKAIVQPPLQSAFARYLSISYG